MEISELNSTFLSQYLSSNPVYRWVIQYVGETYFILFIFTLGMFMFVVFIWYFYQTLSKRDIFELKLDRRRIPEKHERLRKFIAGVSYIVKYGILFPFYVCFWFAVLALFLLFLAKNITVKQILLISVCLVATVRITAYYKEELSRDLAKLLPFVLLAYLLVDPTFFSIELTLSRIGEMINFVSNVIQFLMYAIVLEWFLRILYIITAPLKKSKDHPNKKT